MTNRKEEIILQKQTLRSVMKARRKEAVKSVETEENLLKNFFTLLQQINEEKAVEKHFVYLSHKNEAPTDKLIRLLLEKGQKVFCPRVEGEDMAVVAFSEQTSLSVFGVREPIGTAYQGEIDSILVPFLAVDIKGNRLGYGGGFYDRFFKKNPQAKRIAYGYDFQIVDAVAVDGFDEKIEYIVTDKQIIKINER